MTSAPVPASVADEDGGQADTGNALRVEAVDDDVLRPGVEVTGAVRPVAQAGVDRGDGDREDEADLTDALHCHVEVA
ncbi:hypothetical protein ACFVGX_03900 [Streptomyces sp. NPDC127113]|uniref:hypothetical protein n=1 Tax=Streptomyces sp. NPDC127113 TaxID=3345365 RepID=UPI003643C679